MVKEFLKNDVLVVETGCGAIAGAMKGYLTGEAALEFAGPGLREVCEAVGMPPVLHMGSCVAEIVSTGSDAPGTILSRCSEEFRRLYDQAELVIAKGQANYETFRWQERTQHVLMDKEVRLAYD